MTIFHPSCKRLFDSVVRLNKKYGDKSAIENFAAKKFNDQGCCGYCGVSSVRIRAAIKRAST